MSHTIQHRRFLTECSRDDMPIYRKDDNYKGLVDLMDRVWLADKTGETPVNGDWSTSHLFDTAQDIENTLA